MEPLGAQPFGALRAMWVYPGISQGVCHILRRHILRGPQRWAAAQEDAFRRIHKLLGIPLKIGKGDLCRTIVALGHQIAATSEWAGLKMSEQRRTSVLKRIRNALSTGFKNSELPELAGHTNFWAAGGSRKVSKDTR